jgi:ABC-type dipeptide/oligopeptide/nickel transport system permease component
LSSRCCRATRLRLCSAPQAREDTLAALRQELGLDRPALERYLLWIGGVVQGDLGTSMTYRMPVSTPRRRAAVDHHSL